MACLVLRVCVQALSKIAEDIRGVPIDVVLYVDRLDLYRVDPLDKAVSGPPAGWGAGVKGRRACVPMYAEGKAGR